MNYDHPNNKILVTGKSRTGKTTKWMSLIRDWPARWKFVFDPKLEFARKAKVKPCYTIDQLNEAVTAGGYVVFNHWALFKGEPQEGFAFFCRYAWAQAQKFDGVKVFACDELQNQCRGREALPRALAEMVDAGAKEEIDMLFSAQRPSEIPMIIRSQLSEVYTFKHTDPHQLETFDEWEIEQEAVRALPEKWVYLHRNLDTGETVNSASNTKRKTDRRALA